MSAVWFIVEAQDNDGPEPLGELLRFVVSPSLTVTQEIRSQDEIMDAATAKGYEVSYASSLSGASRFHLEKMEKAVRQYIRYTLGKDVRNRFDIDVEPKVRILIP